jgi:hypothetical protein
MAGLERRLPLESLTGFESRRRNLTPRRLLNGGIIRTPANKKT